MVSSGFISHLIGRRARALYQDLTSSIPFAADYSTMAYFKIWHAAYWTR